MNKLVFIEFNVGGLQRKFWRNFPEKLFRVEVREKEGHLFSGRRIGVGSVSRVSGVGETELTPDGFGVGVPRLEHFGRAHQRAPILENR